MQFFYLLLIFLLANSSPYSYIYALDFKDVNPTEFVFHHEVWIGGMNAIGIIFVFDFRVERIVLTP